METIETITHEGYNIEISHDEFADSPRDMDNIGTMVLFHNRYTLGDKHNYKAEDYSGWDEMKKAIIRKENPAVILPVYMYHHSGITLKIGSFAGLLPQGHAEFDSGMVGFIFVSKEKARRNMEWKCLNKARIEKLTMFLNGEVDVYSHYVNGDVYGYTVKNADGEEIEDGSCSGYYGYDHEKSGLLENAKYAISCEIKDIAEMEKITWVEKHGLKFYKCP